MKINAKTPKQYLEELRDKLSELAKVRAVIKKNLAAGFEETMQYGMIAYVVPLKMFPEGYLEDSQTPLPYVSLASQKNYMALYLSNVYADSKLYDWFVKQYQASGKKLDMGKSCVRFRRLEDLPLEIVGKAIAKTSPQQMIKLYQKARQK